MHADLGHRAQSGEIVLLAVRGAWIELARDASRVIVDPFNHAVRADELFGKHFEMQPFELRMMLQPHVVEVEAIHIDIGSHGRELSSGNAKAARVETLNGRAIALAFLRLGREWRPSRRYPIRRA